MQHKSAYLWGLLGKVAPKAIYLVTTMILARFLNPDDFGQIGVLSVIFVVATVLLESGLGGSLIKEKEITDIDCSTIACFNMFMSISIYIILFFSAPQIEVYFGIDGLSQVVRTISLVFPISAFGIVPRSLLQRSVNFHKIFNNFITAYLIASAASITAAYLGAGVYSLVLYQIVVNLTLVILNSIAVKYRFSLNFSYKCLKKLLPFGLFTSIISVVDTIYENIMTSMTGKYMNVIQAGYLYQSKKIEETCSSSLAGTIGTVTFPILTRLKDDVDAFTREAFSTLKYIVSLTYPLLIAVSLFSKEIIYILFGEKWLDAAFYLDWLIYAGMFMIIETLFRNYVKALCAVKKLLYATLIKRLLGIAIIVGALMVNADYMIYAYVYSSMLGCLINVWLYYNITQKSLFEISRSIIMLVAPILGVLFAYKTSLCHLPFILQFVIYVAFLFLYYFAYLKIFGINVLSLTKRKKVK